MPNFFTELKKQGNNVSFDYNAEIDEKYGSNTYGCLRFKKQFSFTKVSLGALVNTFRYEDFVLKRKIFRDQCEFVKQKNIFPMELSKKVIMTNHLQVSKKKTFLVNFSM